MGATEGTFEAVREDGDGNVGSDKLGGVGCTSPRISFSRDFVLGVSASGCGNGTGRLSPEKRKWVQSSEEDISDEFEFRMSDSRRNGTQMTGEIMLSADELFLNGKLRPLQLSRDRPLARDDLCLTPWRAPEFKHLSLSRHLSFDISHCSALLQPSSLNSQPSQSSPPRQPALPSISTPASPRASSKYSFKIREFFKNKVPLQNSKESSCAQLTRDNSVTSTCRLPISPRSFWPFSRSNSAGESQTTTPAVPDLPPRSNSAGESKSTGRASRVSNRADSVAKAKPSDSSSDTTVHSRLQSNRNGSALSTQASSQKRSGLLCCPPTPPSDSQHTNDVQGSFNSDFRTQISQSLPSTSLAKDESRIQESAGAINVAGSVGETVSVKASFEQSSNQINVPDQSDTSLRRISKPLKSVSKVKVSGSHVRSLRRGVYSPSRNLSKGSPGRRGGGNAPESKASKGKIMLRNLERYKAGTNNVRVGRLQDPRTRSDGRGDGFPVTVRVSPVLNVPIYRRNSSSKTRLFSFRNFFSSRKQLSRDTSINNWRNGA